MVIDHMPARPTGTPPGCSGGTQRFARLRVPRYKGSNKEIHRMTCRRAITSLLVTLFALAASVTLAAPADGVTDVTPRRPATQPATRPVPAIRHVLIISCDGMRPDVLLRADAPNIRKLMARGSFTFWARTIPVAITLPSHTSMLTGVYPERHGINWNDDQPTLGSPKVPTLFALAKKAGYTTAIATGKSKFSTLAKPGVIDWINVPLVKDEDDDAATTKVTSSFFSDTEVADHACAIIAAHKPDVMFIHFPGADKVGHAVGWGTKKQLDAVAEVDAGIGRVLGTLDKTGLADSTVIIVSADHGGAGRGHGGMALGAPIDDPRSRHIPWICAGPGLRENYDLTEDGKLTVNTVDTFATACYLMNIPPGDVDGKPVKQILPPPKELLRSADSTK
jgi:hypothetical protein